MRILYYLTMVVKGYVAWIGSLVRQITTVKRAQALDVDRR